MKDKSTFKEIIATILFITGFIGIVVFFLSIIWLMIAEGTYYHWEYMYNPKPIDTAAIVAGIAGAYIFGASWGFFPVLYDEETENMKHKNNDDLAINLK